MGVARCAGGCADAVDIASAMTFAKVDANQSAIVDALRKVGAFVQSIASVGKGTPDIMVAFRGIWHVMEIKDGNKAPSARKLTKDEAVWHQLASHHAPVHIVESIDQALKVIYDGKGQL